MKLLKLIQEMLSPTEDDIIISPDEMVKFERWADEQIAEINDVIELAGVRIRNIDRFIDDYERGRIDRAKYPESFLTLLRDMRKVAVQNQEVAQQQVRSREDYINDYIEQHKRNRRQEIELIKARENKKLGKEDIIDIFVTALEGGSNYWYEIPFLPPRVDAIKREGGLATSEAIGEYILQGGSIDFHDVELIEYERSNSSSGRDDVYLPPTLINPEESFLGRVTMDSILDAVTLVKRDYPDVWNNILDENADADDADVFLQLCVMGDIVYG